MYTRWSGRFAFTKFALTVFLVSSMNCHRAADDDTIKDIETLIVEVLPVVAFESTRTRNVVPDEWGRGIGSWISGQIGRASCRERVCT